MNVPLWGWFAVLGVIVVMLAVDLFAHRRAHVIRVREAATWSVIWVAVGVGFGAVVWWSYGAEFGQQYFAGYLIEKSLAVDNVFVWAIIFTTSPSRGSTSTGCCSSVSWARWSSAASSSPAARCSIASFGWVLYVFAAFLLFTGLPDDPPPQRARGPGNVQGAALSAGACR